MVSLIQQFEADFLWKVSLKILTSGINLKTFTHILIEIASNAMSICPPSNQDLTEDQLHWLNNIFHNHHTPPSAVIAEYYYVQHSSPFFYLVKLQHSIVSTVKPVLSSHSKIDKTKILKTNGSLMKVESIAECSHWPYPQKFIAFQRIFFFFFFFFFSNSVNKIFCQII